jgi:hypothetical protein
MQGSAYTHQPAHASQRHGGCRGKVADQQCSQQRAGVSRHELPSGYIPINATPARLPVYCVVVAMSALQTCTGLSDSRQHGSEQGCDDHGLPIQIPRVLAPLLLAQPEAAHLTAKNPAHLVSGEASDAGNICRPIKSKSYYWLVSGGASGCAV